METLNVVQALDVLANGGEIQCDCFMDGEWSMTILRVNVRGELMGVVESRDGLHVICPEYPDLLDSGSFRFFVRRDRL